MYNYRTRARFVKERAATQKTDLNITRFVQPSLMQQFILENRTYFAGADKRECQAFHDDIYMLFNQSRLLADGVGTDTLKSWLNTLTPKSDPLSELRKKCTDEQLMQLCKSRYIQSPSELLAWSEYLNDNFEQLQSQANTRVRDYVQAQQKAAASSSQQSDTASE